MTEAQMEWPPVARLMARLCEVPSPSRREAEVAAMVRAELAALGMHVTEDDRARQIDAGCGNITARLEPTTAGTPVMFCAHLDTVPVDGPIEVILTEDGMLTNRLPTILGGDNKAAVAAMLTAVRQVVELSTPHAGIELVFTPCEELSLLGSRGYDPSVLHAEVGFVYDHTGPVGGVIVRAPWHSRITARFVGRAAHAGIAPQEGRSAIAAAAAAIGRMPLGQVNAETTANIGLIQGGAAINVVPQECVITGEARSRDHDALARQISDMLDAVTWAGTEFECDTEVRVEPQYQGYRLTATHPAVTMACRALGRIGATPVPTDSGGGSDANSLLSAGFPCVNLCNDMREIHTAQECIPMDALEWMVDLTLAIIGEARTPSMR
ncbi:MAG: M20/M25/M40 family metallo-hydrolase [Thermoleophilia bacterium]